MTGEAEQPGQEPEVITYSLRNGSADSTAYYRDVARFADEVVAAGTPLLPVVAEFVPPSRRAGANPYARTRSTCSSS